MNNPPYPTRLLIEDWLPIEEIGVEGRREHSTGQHPPPNRLHVWWSRKPLIAARATVLASLLPAWSAEWPEWLLGEFPTPKDYREWFIHLIGVRGNPVQAERKIREAVESGSRIANPYDGPRAFTLGPETDDLHLFQKVMNIVWGTEKPVTLDPTAGGGPSLWSRLVLVFEPMRMSLIRWRVLFSSVRFCSRPSLDSP